MVVVGVIAVIALVRGPAGHQSYVFEDHRVSAETVNRMKHGEGFYKAFDGALTDAEIGPVSESRSFRVPTVYLLWRWLPGTAPDGYWRWFVVMVAVSALLLAAATTAPWIAPLVALYLLNAGREPFGGLFMMVEFWVVPALALVLLATRRGWSRVAPAAAFVAVVVRELAAGVLLGGLLAAARRRQWRRLAWWGGATVAAAVVLLVHWHLAAPYLVDHGKEAPLIGSGRFPTSLEGQLGFLLPGPELVGVVLWAVALFWLWRRDELDQWGPHLLLLPAAAITIHRPYWGLLLVPFTMTWTAEALTSVLPTRLRQLVGIDATDRS
jgi:hypothetical protein